MPGDIFQARREPSISQVLIEEHLVHNYFLVVSFVKVAYIANFTPKMARYLRMLASIDRYD